MTTLIAHWQGPFGFYGYEGDLPPIPRDFGSCGYLKVFPDGWIVDIGQSKVPRERFKQHRRARLKGKHHIYDLDAARIGKRVENWTGWSFAAEHPELFERRREFVIQAAEADMAASRIYLAPVLADEALAQIVSPFQGKRDTDEALREWVEAALIRTLLDDPRAGAFVDTASLQRHRPAKATPVELVNVLPDEALIGLPERLAL